MPRSTMLDPHASAAGRRLLENHKRVDFFPKDEDVARKDVLSLRFTKKFFSSRFRPPAKTTSRAIRAFYGHPYLRSQYLTSFVRPHGSSKLEGRVSDVFRSGAKRRVTSWSVTVRSSSLEKPRAAYAARKYAIAVSRQTVSDAYYTHVGRAIGQSGRRRSITRVPEAFIAAAGLAVFARQGAQAG